MEMEKVQDFIFLWGKKFRTWFVSIPKDVEDESSLFLLFRYYLSVALLKSFWFGGGLMVFIWV